MITLALLTLLAALLTAPTVGAYKVRHKPAGYVDSHLHLFRLHTNALRAAKCLPRHPIGLAADQLPPKGSAFRREIRVTWKRRHYRAAAAGSSCELARAWAWHYSAPASCVRRNEGGLASVNPAGPYYGWYQADADFQRAYGRAFYDRWGAGIWPAYAQVLTAYRGWRARGWSPWPNTARECGLL